MQCWSTHATNGPCSSRTPSTTSIPPRANAENGTKARPIRLLGKAHTYRAAFETRSRTSISLQDIEHLRIHDVDWVARRIRVDLIENIRKLDFVLVPRHVSDVWCTHNVVHG